MGSGSNVERVNSGGMAATRSGSPSEALWNRAGSSSAGAIPAERAGTDGSRNGERAAEGEPERVAAPASALWSLSAFAGRFAEISGDAAGAPLTLVFRLLVEAQRRGEPVAWIGRRESCFFPPDAADAGIDLAALPVVWARDAITAAGAADLLVRSGAFGLVVMDLGAEPYLPLSVQARLAGLARQHAAGVVCITEKDDGRASLGSLVSLRAQAERTAREKERYRCEARVLKDKGASPGGRFAEVCRGPDGLH